MPGEIETVILGSALVIGAAVVGIGWRMNRNAIEHHEERIEQVEDSFNEIAQLLGGSDISETDAGELADIHHRLTTIQEDVENVDETILAMMVELDGLEDVGQFNADDVESRRRRI